MTRYRFCIRALAALSLSWLAAAAVIADEKSAQDQGKATKAALRFGGKVVRVDKDKHTIMVRDLVDRKGKETIPGAAKGTELEGTMLTFRIADKARISLDGKDAGFGDLKAGLFVRVHFSREGIEPKAKPDKSERTTSRVEAFTKTPSRGGD